MDRPHGIIVFGPNGSGKTTLGREVARLLNFWSMDIEDYHFAESEIPYTIERPRGECLRLMLADIEKYRSFVLTAVTGDFGERISSLYELAVRLFAPKDLRLRRIEERGREQHGARVLPGGDIAERQREFIDFVASRSLERIERWAQTLICPVMELDGGEDWRANAARIAERYRAYRVD